MSDNSPCDDDSAGLPATLGVSGTMMWRFPSGDRVWLQVDDGTGTLTTLDVNPALVASTEPPSVELLGRIVQRASRRVMFRYDDGNGAVRAVWVSPSLLTFDGDVETLPVYVPPVRDEYADGYVGPDWHQYWDGTEKPTS